MKATIYRKFTLFIAILMLATTSMGSGRLAAAQPQSAPGQGVPVASVSTKGEVKATGTSSSRLSAYAPNATTLINSSFEVADPTVWSFANTTGATDNKWVINTGTSSGGTRSAYITNNSAGSPPPNTYTKNNSFTPHIYKQVTFPAGETAAVLSFDWKGIGEHSTSNSPGNGSTWDYMRVSVSTSAPSAGSLPSTSDQIPIIYNAQPTFVTGWVTIPAAQATGTKYIIFTWTNDGSGGADPPAAIDNVSLVSQVPAPLTGTKTIGSGSDYPSFGSAIANLNANGVGAGGVTFDVTAGSTFNETPPTLTATGTSLNPIVFQKNGAGANPKIIAAGTGNWGPTQGSVGNSVSATGDAVVTIGGGDYITFDGIDVASADFVTNVTAIEYGYLIRNAATTNGAQNVTVKNTAITLNRTNTVGRGIFQVADGTTAGSFTPSSAAGANSNNKYYNLTIGNAYNGILLTGNSSFPDLNTEVGIVSGGTTTIGSSANPIGGSSITAYGIRATSQSSVKIFNAEVQFVSVTSSVVVGGIFVESGQGTTNEVKYNKVHDISTTSTSTSSIIYGIRTDINSGGVGTVFNNFIYGFSHGITTASATQVGRALAANVAGTGSVTLYYNSVRQQLGAAASNTAFYVAGGTITTRNNIFANFTPTQVTAKHYAYFLSGGTITSSNNDLYISSGTGAGTNGFTGISASTDRITLTDWQTATGQDAASIAADPLFFSTTDLHITALSPAINAGVTIAGIVDDIDAQARPQGPNPDIGADEFYPTPGTLQFSSATYSAAETAGTATINVTRSGGSNGIVTVDYATVAGGSATGGASCSAGIDYITTSGTLMWADLDGAPKPFSVTLCADGVFETAETVNLALSNPTGGATLGTPNTAVLTITDAGSVFSGTYSVGTGQNATSLTNPGGMFEAINNGTVTGNVTIKITSDLTGETGAVALNEFAPGFTLTIKPGEPAINPSGAPRTITGSSAGHMIPFYGADMVTIDGSLSGGTDRSLTVTNTGAGGGIGFMTGTNGAQNNTIKNVNVWGGSPTATIIGIAFGGNTFGTAGADNDNNRVENCDLRSSIYGIYSVGASAANKNTGVVITRNVMTASGAARIGRVGIFVGFDDGIQITENNISGMVNAESADVIAIAVGSQSLLTTAPTPVDVTNAFIARNNIGLVQHTATFSAAGIVLASGTSGTNTVANNMISGVIANANAGDIVAGIYVVPIAGSTQNIYHNSVSMTGARGATASQYGSFGLAIAGANNPIDVRDNILYNTQTQTGGGAGGRSYAIGVGYTTFTNLTSNYNDLYVSGAQATLGITGALLNVAGGGTGTDRIDLAAWQGATGKDANSQSVDPLYTSLTDLHLQAGSPLLGDGILVGINNDFDNDLRDDNPEIGADEITTGGRTGTIPAGTYRDANIGAGTLGGNVTIQGNLTLSGILNTGANTLIIDCAGTVTGASTSNFVIGSVQKNFCATGSFTFPVGTSVALAAPSGSITSYSPVTANVTTLITNPSSLTVKANAGPQPVLNPSTSLQRYWTLTEGGQLTADLTFNYLDTDVMGNEAAYRVIRVIGSTAVSFPNDCPTPAVGKGCVDTTANTGTVPGVSEFSDWALGEPVAPTLARLESLTATRASDGSGTLIEWKTGYEVSNLGFNLYRSEGDSGKRTHVNPSSLVAGSAFMSGGAAPAGRSYSWFDSAASSANTRYWLEDVDLKGKATMHGPYSTVAAKPGQSIAKQNQSPLLSTLGQTQGAAKPVDRYGIVPKGAGPTSTNTLAGQGAVKLSVKQEGFYRVSQAELLAAGLDANADPRNLQLFVDGQQIPIRVTGEADGRLDTQDSVEFYGLGLDTPTTNTHVYWLVAGEQAGMRVEQVKAAGAANNSGSFPYTVERKDRIIYFTSLLNGDAENFFGPLVTGQSVAQTLTITNLDASSPTQAVLELALQGVTAQAHQVAVKMNGTDVGVITFSNMENKVATFNISQSLLHEGVNTVTLISTGAGSDVSLVDHVRVTYAHTYRADSDTLRLTAQGGREITVDGFSTAKVRVLDVTNPAAPVELAGTVQGEQGTYSVSLTLPGTGERTLVALENSQALPVVSATANQPTSWRTTGQGADLVIVTHSSLINSLKPLASYRSGQGYKVAIVNMEDVYDEFSYGVHTPQALRDFTSYANSNWSVKPRYLLFAGDSSLDPKNYLGMGDDLDFVPTRLIDTQYMETASDDWLADFDSDGIADLAMGRLPVQTTAEADRMVQKIIGYDQTTVAGGALLVSGTNDETYNFEEASARLREILSPQMAVTEVNRGNRDPGVVKAEMIAAINRGQKIVNYTGHGSVDLWGGSLFANADARALTNGQNLSLFVAMTCLNGYYQDPALDSLAESLMKAEQGGAIAVWSSTGMTTPELQNVMNQSLYRALFNGTPIGQQPLPIRPTLGEAIMTAKSSVTNLDVRRTWILFGDPMTTLR